jgi:hypothetical protein
LRYAQGAKGVVNIFARDAHQKGVFNQIEFPELRASGNVRKYVYRGYGN